MTQALKYGWKEFREAFMKFRLSDYRDLSTILFYLTLLIIFCQKLSFLFDKHFFYEVGEHMPDYSKSLSLTMTLFFDLARMHSIRIFMIAAELLLLLRCIFRKPDFKTFFTLLGFAFVSYQSTYYLQEGGMNISLFCLGSAALYVLAVSDFIKSTHRQDQIFRAYIFLLRVLVLLYVFTTIVTSTQDIFWHGADAGFGLYLTFGLQLAFPLMIFFRKTRNTIFVLSILLQLLLSSRLNLWLYTGSIIVFYSAFLNADEAHGIMRWIRNLRNCPIFPKSILAPKGERV